MICSGFTSDFSNKCSICDKDLIDQENLIKFRQNVYRRQDQENTYKSILFSSFFTFNKSDKQCIDVSFPDYSESNQGRGLKMKSLLMYRCGHQFHKNCVKNKFNEDNNVEIIEKDDEDQE